MNKESIELLAVDGGGTNTRAVLVDGNGMIIGEGKAGASNYHVVGEEGAKASLVEAILGAFTVARMVTSNVVKVKKAVFALAGIDTDKDKEEVERVVQQAIKDLFIEVDKVIVENDCLSALLGATKNKPGILLIAGTGSIVFAHDGNNRIVRSGGWGHRVGDEGSGYWIGDQAIRSVLKMYDGRGQDTLLCKLILDQFGFSSVEDLYNWAYSDSYSVEGVGSLAALVDEAFRQGDTVSKAILDAAVLELFLLIKTVIKKVNIEQDEIDLIIQGGVFDHINYIKEQVIQKIEQSNTKVTIFTTTDEPITYIIKRGLKLE